MAVMNGPEPIEGFSVVTLIVYGVLMLGTIPVLLYRRYLQPLKFRDTYLLIATIAMTYLATICTVLWIYITVPPCPLQVLVQTPFVYMLALIMARFWKLLLASHLTSARLIGNGDAWIMRNPWMASSRVIWRGVLSLGTALALIQLIISVSSDECCWSPNYYIWSSTLLMVYWSSIAIMTWMLRKIQDGFFVVKELKMLGLQVLITNVLVILYLGSGMAEQSPNLAPGFIVISSMVQMMIQTWYPIWKSYQMVQSADHKLYSTVYPIEITSTSQVSKRLSGAPLTTASTFLDILRHPDGFEAMKQFLTLEFSVENILCWEMLHERKHERRPDLVDEHFKAVYESFVRSGSCNEVNINSQLRNYYQIVASGQAGSLDAIMHLKAAAKLPKGSISPDEPTEVKIRLLKHLSYEIVRLMEQDSYPRFLQSNLYRDLFQSKGCDIRHVQSSSAEMKVDLKLITER